LGFGIWSVRLIIVGTPRQREQMRERLETTAPDIAGEFDSLDDARGAGIGADAILLAPAPPAATDDEPPFTESLTPRELGVLELVALGLSNKAIAARLGISDQTVKFHLTAITGKLGAANRTDAVRRAVRRGLIAL
jgi:DNA-binding NarL/FixJ family response regulator